MPLGAEGQRAPADFLAIGLERVLRCDGLAKRRQPACLSLQPQHAGQTRAAFPELGGVIIADPDIDHRREHAAVELGCEVVAQNPRAGLHHGTDSGGAFAVHPGQAAQHGQENVVRRLFRHLAGQAVIELHRRAIRDVGLLHAALEHTVVRAGGDLQVEAEFAQKRGEKRQHALERELVGDGDGFGPRRGPERGDQRGHQRLPLAERIGRQVGQLFLARALVVERAGAAPVEPLAAAGDHRVDGIDAAPVAGAAAAGFRVADERFLGLNPGVEKPLRVEDRVGLPLRFLAGEQGDAERADRAGIRRNDDFGPRLPRDRRRERIRGERHALAENHRTDGTVAFHAMQVILDDRIVKPGDDLALVAAGGHRLTDDFGHEHGAMLA